MAESKTPSPRHFGDEIAATVKQFVIPVTLTIATIDRLWNELGAFSFLDSTNGELAWLKGTIGNRLYHINPKHPRKRNCQSKPDWTAWRKKTNVSDEMWRNRRKIADKFTRAQARKPVILEGKVQRS